MRSLFCFLLAFMASNTHLIAQTGSVTGKITSGGQPIPFANVGIKSESQGAMTTEEGIYIIEGIRYGTYEISASFVGYKQQKRKVRVSAESPNPTINFILEESATSLDEVVVSGTMKEVSKLESPVPVEVYNTEFFQFNPTPSIFESLQNVNGVRPQLNCNVCNTGDIHINGMEGPYTMVLIDGMPIVSGLSTVYGLTGIPQSLIEKVEIVKGPASTLYGSEAVGGLINIITKDAGSAATASADVFATSWGEVNTDLGYKFKAGQKANSLLGLNYFYYGNPIDNNGDNFTDVTLQNRVSIFNKWSFDRSENRIFSLAGRYVYEDRWGGEMQWSPEYRGGNEIYGESIFTKRWESMGIYELPTSEKISIQFSANGHDQNSVYGDTEYLAEQYIGFGQATWHKSIGKHETLLGAAYRYVYYDDNTPATGDVAITHLPGVFVQDQITLNDQNKLLIGLRYDHNNVHGNIFSPRLNYKWNSKDKLNVLRFSVGNGFRVANVFTEDHAALTGSRDVIFEGELRPERSWNTNLNYIRKIYTANETFIGLDASLFYTHFDNRIVPDYETNPQQIIYSNLEGTAASKGFSLNLDMSLPGGLTILGGFTAMDVTITEDGETKRQLLTEQFSGVWSVSYTFIPSMISIDYTGNIYGPMRLPLLGDLDDRDEFSPWWSVQNIQISKKFVNGIEIYGGVKNLLNFTPPANSIARSFDPFDEQVQFDTDGNVIPTADNPNALTFDPSYVYAPNQGIRGFLGIRYAIF